MVYAALIVNVLLMIIIPIILGIGLVRRYSLGWNIFLLGMAGFIISQVLHIPFNQFLLNPYADFLLGEEQALAAVITVSILVGLSAGVFEEITRYFLFRWRTTVRSWEQGVLFGAGWGGVEAIIAGLLAATVVVNVFLYQSGMTDSLVSAEQVANNPEAIATLAQRVEEIISVPLWQLLIGALERVFAITLHISLSLLVLQTYVRRNIFWLFVAIGWHTIVNAVTVYGLLQEWDIVLIEIPLAVAAAISLLIILRLRQSSEPPTPNPAQMEPA